MLKFHSTEGFTLSFIWCKTSIIYVLWASYLSYSPENQKQQGCSNWEYYCRWSYNSVEDCINIPSKANERRKSAGDESSLEGNGKRSVDRKYNGCNHTCDVNISGSISLVIKSGVKWKLHFPEYCTDVEYPPQSEMNDGICHYYACNGISHDNENLIIPEPINASIVWKASVFLESGPHYVTCSELSHHSQMTR